ncbi:hypothetical protein Angca_004459, partial [Angiostrongylus cantonensis]
MPFIQDRSAFLQSKSHDRQADCSGGGHENFPESSRGGGADPSARYPGLSASTLPSSADDPFAGAVLGLADVVTKLVIAHPCMVLRRQCQVHQNARSLHLTPFTLVPVVCKMVANEGIMTFWKGSVGSCVLWGLSNVTEIVLADLFGLPRHIVPNGSTAKYWKHILLKAFFSSAVLALTPFFVSTFTETVRSESGLGGEGPSVMEVLVRGIDRLRFPIFGSKDSSRRFSVLHLAAPTVFYRTSHYIIQRKLYYQFFKMARKYVNKKPEAERKKFHQYIPQMFAQTSSTIVTDLILFPVETIMHRMYIQGTRTLIDNLDTGLSAISITAKYSGFVDCFRSVFQHEGFCALYSGVGALALEYLLHSLLHQAVRACFDRGSEVRSRQFSGSISSPFAGTSSGTVSGPATQSMSPVISPRKQHSSHTPPIRDPTQFPTFGESVSQLDSSLPTSTFQFPFHSNRPNAFGSPPSEYWLHFFCSRLHIAFNIFCISKIYGLDDDDFEPEVQSLAPAPPPPVVEAEPVKPDAHVLKPKKVFPNMESFSRELSATEKEEIVRRQDLALAMEMFGEKPVTGDERPYSDIVTKEEFEDWGLKVGTFLATRYKAAHYGDMLNKLIQTVAEKLEPSEVRTMSNYLKTLADTKKATVKV